jgi:hypothetical protein
MRKRQDQDTVPLTDERETVMKEDELNEGAQLARQLAKRWLAEAELIPLTVLSLDNPEPVGGWETLLQARGIELLTDDLYRPSVRREDARRLALERREWERESADKARQLQESLDEGLPVPAGLPSVEGASPMASIMANDPFYRTPQAEFGRPRPRFLEEELEAGARQQAAARAEAEAKKAARGRG